MSSIKQIAIGTFLTVIIFVQLFLSLRIWKEMPSRPEGFWATNDKGVVSLGNIYDQEALLRLAPFQDFVFVNNKKISLRERGIKLKYVVTIEANKILLTRSFPSSLPEISGIGSSIFYCSTCSVVYPTQKIAFYSAEVPVKSGALQAAIKLGYRLHLSESGQLPKIPNLAIVNIFNGRSATVIIPPGSKVTLNDVGRILEVDNFSAVSTQEIIY